MRFRPAAGPARARTSSTLARTFGVPPAFFCDDYDPAQAGLLQEQVELIALIRDARITSARLRSILQLTPGARQAIAGLIDHTTRTDTRPRHRDQA